MNAQSRVGFSVPRRAVCRGLLAGLLLPMLTAGCGISEPSSSEEIILEPFETTWLSEPEPIDPVTHPPEDPPPGEVMVDSLLYKADVLVEDTALGTGPMSLTLRVRLRNPFDDPVTIQVPGCPRRPRAYPTMNRVDPPIWNPSPISGAFLGFRCAEGEFDVTVPPREETTGGSTWVRPTALSRELPDGRYYFTMEYHRVDEEPLLFQVGSVDVRFQEPGLEFGVTVEDTGETVRAEVRVTNRNDVPMLLEWGGCAMSRLELYHDAARSNLATGLFAGCPDPLFTVTVGPGEAIHPDEFKREFNHADALDLPPGTYFLSVRLDINSHDYHIPAGEILLR